MPVWPGKVSGRQRRDTIAQKVLKKEKVGHAENSAVLFFHMTENKCSGNNRQ